MFKRSEEQEWSRFRGALSKDREDANATATPPGPEVTDANAAASGASPVATPAAPGSGPGPSFRPSTGDVNVGLPASTRLSRANSDGSEVESLIGERTSFEGTLKSEGAVRLLGSVQGEIHSKSMIYVEERAHVTARLTAAQVTVAGHVDGQIFCEGRCEIRPTGHVTGEINAGALIVQEGAYFDGNSKMATSANSATSSSPSGSASSNSA
jgi:cytoskeletal protein CcmA (bactofilin family)